MSNLVPHHHPSQAMSLVSRHTERALAQIGERALLRSAEIASIAHVGQTALRTAAEVSLAKSELSKLAPEAGLSLAAIADATTLAIQARVLELGAGL